ncbi:DUF6531 domain-containing protein [Streptomyces sp. NBC_01283]|uniref:DUF6531 domain-containing protein n=1 Tax=Streptomyces sp. NBC_01283 TaxID=2903812 RepID=UPI00352E3359|nr:DUF6531 domain-containing protein [Streptomyces sp. NBC_01283]
MSHRPADWHVLDLDKDPTPGDPDRVRNLAKNLHDFADDVSKVLRDIKGMAGEDAILTWAGKTAESFTSEFEDAPGKLKKLKKSYEMAGDALSTYWPELERSQALADKALAKGREAQTSLSAAQSRLTSADSWVDRAGKEADKYKDDDGGSKAGKDVPKPDPDKVKAATRNANSAEKAQTAAKSDVSAAQSSLDAAKKMAEDARKMRQDAAGTAKKKLEDASDAGIQNRKWWEEVGDWVTDNWDTIVAVCKVVVAVLGVIAMIIGGPILGAIVLIAALVVLADTLNKYANGEASLWDVAFAALDCIPGMKGLTSLRGLAKGMKGLKAGLKGLKSARGALTKGAKGAFNRLKGKIKGCGDPVDAATGQMFLDATDITLPGTLPLAFTRRVASGYRTGGWFGPTWTSTIDQRLELDEQGIVFVTEDGMLLEYPHPQGPDAAVLPISGPRWPLTRRDDGSYRVADPIIGHTRCFGAPFDDTALLTRISDRNHNTIDVDYDTEGAPLAIRHSGGYHLALTVEEERITALSLTNAGENHTDVTIKQYEYTDGNLTAVTNSYGSRMLFTYDEQLRITSWTDSNHSRYNYTYDEQDRCIAQGGEAEHLSHTFVYDVIDPEWPGCRVTEVTTAEGSTSRLVVDDRCMVIAEIDPLGGVVRTDYDAHQHVTAWTDELGNTTRIVNNGLGQPVEVTRPDGAVVRVAYNSLALATAIDLPDGTSWQYAYDERGNCTSTVDPSGATSQSTYTSQGHPVTTTDELGHVTRVRCNPAGLPLEVTDPLDATISWARDAWGRPVAVTDETGRTTRLGWSTEGRLVHRLMPDGATEAWTYDGEGNLTSHTDQLGQVSHFEYTHFDLLSARTNPDGARHEFTYDTSLRLKQVTNSMGMTWSYDHDEVGRLKAETDFDGRTLTYTHDATGRLASRTDALGQTITFDRDVLGQVVRKDAAGTVSTYSHDLLGRLTHATASECTLVLERDRAGRLLTESVNGRTLTYAYDDAGRRTGRTTPVGATSTRTYDAVGHLARINAAGRVIDFDRDASGREVARHIGANVTLARAYDEAGRLTAQSVTAEDGRSIQHRAYTYRADGNLTGIDDQISGTRHFDLDSAARVTAVRARGWTESYAYDAAGNQMQSDWPDTHPGHESSGPRAYTGTRLTRAGRIRYEYDALGRVTLRQRTRLSRRPDTWRYAWDAEDRLTSVTTPDGTCWVYLYDPLGRRTAKQRLASDNKTIVEETVFTWDGSTLCEQTTTAPNFPNPVTLTWEHQGLAPVAQTERVSTPDEPQHEIDSRFFSMVTDLIGTPTELIDETGGIAWRARSTLWGKTAWPADSATYTPLRFPGQYHDPETGLHYNYLRYYDPESARYLTSDPLGLEPAPNTVTYVNNPHMWVDPHGLSPCRPWVIGKGDDPLVPELADEIHARYPGHMKAQGVDIVGADGKPLTDFDIVTGNAVVQVKDGSGKGALKQALNTQSLTDYPVIVYLPKGRGSVIKSLEEAGIMVTRDKETLMQVLAP